MKVRKNNVSDIMIVNIGYFNIGVRFLMLNLDMYLFDGTNVSCICCKNFKVCLTILGHYTLKG